MDFEMKLTALCQRERQRINQLKKEINRQEKKSIYMRRRGNKTYFYECSNGKEKGITSDKKRVWTLTRQEMINTYIRTAEHNYDLIEKCLKEFKTFKLNKYEKIMSELEESRVLYTKKQLEWLEEPYERNSFHSEQMIYTTTNGVKMRSKSELNIANRLEAHRIIYRAEPAMIIAGRSVYPDFVILKEDGTIVIWEHFGLMDNAEYRQRAYEKIEMYRKLGYVQHVNLICTYEEDVRSVADIDKIIQRFLFD